MSTLCYIKTANVNTKGFKLHHLKRRIFNENKKAKSITIEMRIGNKPALKKSILRMTFKLEKYAIYHIIKYRIKLNE